MIWKKKNATVCSCLKKKRFLWRCEHCLWHSQQKVMRTIYRSQMRNRTLIQGRSKRFLFPPKRPSGSRAQPSSYSLHAGGSFVGLMWPWCKADLSHPSSQELRKIQATGPNSNHPYACMAYTGGNFTWLSLYLSPVYIWYCMRVKLGLSSYRPLKLSGVLWKSAVDIAYIEEGRVERKAEWGLMLFVTFPNKVVLYCWRNMVWNGSEF